MVIFRGICGLDKNISWGNAYQNYYENQENVVKHILQLGYNK